MLFRRWHWQVAVSLDAQLLDRRRGDEKGSHRRDVVPPRRLEDQHDLVQALESPAVVYGLLLGLSLMKRRRELQEELLQLGQAVHAVERALTRREEHDDEPHDGWRVPVRDVNLVASVGELEQGGRFDGDALQAAAAVDVEHAQAVVRGGHVDQPVALLELEDSEGAAGGEDARDGGVVHGNTGEVKLRQALEAPLMGEADVAQDQPPQPAAAGEAPVGEVVWLLAMFPAGDREVELPRPGGGFELHGLVEHRGVGGRREREREHEPVEPGAAVVAQDGARRGREPRVILPRR